LSEATNLTALDGGRPKIEVRMPTFKNGADFVGILAAGDATDALSALDAGKDDDGKIDEMAMLAALGMLVKNALRSPAARDELLYLMADLWVYEPPESVVKADEPPEEWEYDPPADLVKKGQIGRDERWRSLSVRQKKRLVKKLELESYPVNLAGEFVEAFKRMPYIADFLESRKKSEPDADGSSQMPSPDATDGVSDR
jgi:hypothetical protein